MNKRIFLSPPHTSGKENIYISQAVEQNWLAPGGPFVEKFEEGLKALTGSPEVVATVSGTAAIHLALLASGIKEGDVVFCPSFTFAATIFPVQYINAEPVLVDPSERHWNMDAETLERSILEEMRKGKTCKAILIADIYGKTAGLQEIVDLAQKYNLILIEDAAEAVGSYSNKKPAGTIGDIGIYSFNGNKILTTTQGGALICKNPEIAEKARLLANQASTESLRFFHTETGYNYRLSNLLAAVGCAQLEILEAKIEKRKQVNRWYREFLSDDGIRFLSETTGEKWNHWLSCILFPETSTVEKLPELLKKENIECKRLMTPVNLQPSAKDLELYSNGTASYLYKHGLALPSGEALEKKDIARICKMIKLMVK